MTDASRPPFRAILAGCGQITGLWFDALDGIDAITVVGLVDLVRERARALAAERAPAAGIYDDLGTAIDDLRPDLVFDCTVPEAHAAVSGLALSRGCHVVTEKPLAATRRAAADLVRAAASSGRVHAIVQNRRFTEGMRRVGAALATDAIGPLSDVHVDFFMAPHFTGFRTEMRHVLLLDMAVHTFDQARKLIGADPVSAFCREWNPAGSWYAADAAALAMFEFDNGVMLTYRGSWCAEGPPDAWDGRWRLVGRNGSLFWDGGATVEGERAIGGAGFWADREPIPQPPSMPGPDGHAAVLLDTVDALAHGRPPETRSADNLRSLAMVFAAVDASEQGRWVDVRPYYQF